MGVGDVPRSASWSLVAQARHWAWQAWNPGGAPARRAGSATNGRRTTDRTVASIRFVLWRAAFGASPDRGAASWGCTVNHARSPDHDRHGELRPLLGRSESAGIDPCLGNVTTRGRSAERSAMLANRRTCGGRRGRSEQAKNVPPTPRSARPNRRAGARSTPGRQCTAASSAPCLRFNHTCVSWEANARFIATSSTRGIQHGSDSAH